MLKIVDTYEDILALRSSIIKDQNFDLNDWKNYKYYIEKGFIIRIKTDG